MQVDYLFSLGRDDVVRHVKSLADSERKELLLVLAFLRPGVAADVARRTVDAHDEIRQIARFALATARLDDAERVVRMSEERLGTRAAQRMLGGLAAEFPLAARYMVPPEAEEDTSEWSQLLRATPETAVKLLRAARPRLAEDMARRLFQRRVWLLVGAETHSGSEYDSLAMSDDVAAEVHSVLAPTEWCDLLALIEGYIRDARAY